jgi:glycosyltransferase involved in cell wall biosynthesis
MVIESRKPAAKVEAPGSSTIAMLDRPATGPALSVVVPTRNEAANVEPLLERLARCLGDVDYELIFVDDSDDGTPDLLEEQAERGEQRILLRHRPAGDRKDGLSGAVLEGLAIAGGEYVAVIDADLQHPPELLPQMLERATTRGADVVVASRYVAGGSVDGLGGLSRKLLSQATRWFSRVLFHERIWNVQDPCSGFFIFRRSMLDHLTLRPIGYKILLEVLMRTPWVTLEEVPYQFAERTGGDSKANLNQGLLFLRHSFRLFREVPSAGRIWKFFTVGATGAVVNLSLLWLLGVEAGLARVIAWPIALEASVLTNYALNRNMTWHDRRASGAAGIAKDGLRYHVAVAAGLAVSTGVFTVLSWLGLPILLAGVGGIISGAASNYLGADRLVFVTQRRKSSVRQVTEHSLHEETVSANS